MGNGKKKIPLGRTVKNTLDVFGGVKILSIQEKEAENEFSAGQMEADLKSIIANGENKLTIHFKVFATQKVSLWVEYQPSKTHEDFYGAYKNKTFLPPRVALLIDNKQYKVGKHVLEWDGRDQTKDKRLLLAGKYKVKLSGTGVGLPKDETELIVGKPLSHLFGINYKKKGAWESTKKELKKIKKNLESLQDKTSYNVSASWDSTAVDAVELWKDCAVTYLTGHSRPTGFWLYSKDGGNYNKKYTSIIHMAMRGVKPPHANLSEIFRKKKLDDMFLVFFNGCRAGNEVYLAQLVLNKFFPGPYDGKHGEKTTKGLRYYQYWVDIKPTDGTKNPATYMWFHIAPSGLSEKDLTKIIQKHLRSYYCGKTDGKLGDKTEKAIKSFQRDHPDLKETGVLDDATWKVLSPYYAKEEIGRNLAEQVMFNGADIAIGFLRNVGWNVSYKWGINFWKAIAQGKGVASSAADAAAKTDVRQRKGMEHRIYAQKGISKDVLLHPARYGRYFGT